MKYYMSFLKLKKILFTATGLLIINFVFFLPTQAVNEENTNYGLDTSAQKIPAFSEQVTNYNSNFLNTQVGSIIGLVLSFIGVIFLILMIYAGINWMTATGNQEKVTKSKDLIINAIIGLIIVLAAYAITSFIGNQLL